MVEYQLKENKDANQIIGIGIMQDKITENKMKNINNNKIDNHFVINLNFTEVL